MLEIFVFKKGPYIPSMTAMPYISNRNQPFKKVLKGPLIVELNAVCITPSNMSTHC